MESVNRDEFARRILFEDNHLIILGKLPSEIVQGDKTGDVPLSEVVKSYIKRVYGKPGNVFIGVVHRIDRPVSGVVVFARTSKALARLNTMLRERQIKKTYWAVVQSPPPFAEGHLIHWLWKNQGQNKSYVADENKPGAKKAELKYRELYQSERYHLLEVELLTGRHHQIRAQLAAMGCPIRGDVKYGFSRPNHDGSIHLHARSLAMPHPVGGKLVEVVAPLPGGDALWKSFEAMMSDKKQKG